MKPTNGRIVLFVNRIGETEGEHSPAIISRVWGDTCVNLHIMQQDALAPMRLETSRMLDESPSPQAGTWHWPRRA